MICPKCNNEYDSNLGDCPFCGYKAKHSAENDNAEPIETTATDNLTNANISESNQDNKDDTNAATKEKVIEDAKDTGIPEYDDGYNKETATIEHGESEEIYNSDDSTMLKSKKSGISPAVKIVIAVASALIIVLVILFTTGVIKVSDNGQTINNSSTASGENTSGNNSGISYKTEVNEINENTTSNSSGNSSSLDSNSQNNSSTTSENNNSKPNSNSNSSNTSSSNGNNSSSSSQGSDSSNNPDSSPITINGQTFNVGDKITYSVYLSGINAKVAGVNITMHYNSSLLKIDDTSFATPNLMQVAHNTKLEDKMKFNAIDSSKGFDFSQEKLLYQVSFVIQDSSATSCDITTEIVELFDIYIKDITDKDMKETVTKE